MMLDVKLESPFNFTKTESRTHLTQTTYEPFKSTQIKTNFSFIKHFVLVQTFDTSLPIDWIAHVLFSI